MSMSGPGGSGFGGGDPVSAGGWLCTGGEGGHGRDSGGPGGRRKRRRQRTQRQKRRRPPHLGGGGGGGGGGGHIDHVSRERMFQDIEGLLRQIRERAEETPLWTQDQMNDFTQTVTGFMRALEEEGGQVSDRAMNEYHRVRDKLSQALRL